MAKRRRKYLDVPGFERLYQVSKMGDVKSFRFGGKIMKPHKNPYTGYLQVTFSVKGKNTNFKVHELIAMVFLGYDMNDPKSKVNHKGKDTTDNRASNLFITTI